MPTNNNNLSQWFKLDLRRQYMFRFSKVFPWTPCSYSLQGINANKFNVFLKKLRSVFVLVLCSILLISQAGLTWDNVFVCLFSHESELLLLLLFQSFLTRVRAQKRSESLLLFERELSTWSLIIESLTIEHLESVFPESLTIEHLESQSVFPERNKLLLCNCFFFLTLSPQISSTGVCSSSLFHESLKQLLFLFFWDWDWVWVWDWVWDWVSDSVSV